VTLDLVSFADDKSKCSKKPPSPGGRVAGRRCIRVYTVAGTQLDTNDMFGPQAAIDEIVQFTRQAATSGAFAARNPDYAAKRAG